MSPYEASGRCWLDTSGSNFKVVIYGSFGDRFYIVFLVWLFQSGAKSVRSVQRGSNPDYVFQGVSNPVRPLDRFVVAMKEDWRCWLCDRWRQ